MWGAMLMRDKPVRAMARAVAVGVALAGFLSVGQASPAIGLELPPEAISLIRVEAPAEVRLPSVATEVWHSLDHPSYGKTSAEKAAALAADARNAGDQVSNTAQTLSDDPLVQQLIRDCAKDGLKDSAWSLWWSSIYNQPFDLAEETKKSILNCLQTYIYSDSSTLAGIAETLTAHIARGALAALEEDNDRAGLSDWMQVVNYYFIPQ
jgi:hypothetical protein